ncbi:hypothetical protein IMSHALPRED_008388 [Imshaugia aleurites]|uniref:Uncharacterized protein n=1 Tax=Imshaugia aleurites TaxID=172621 RepID=A0A8H3I901_9LECA|nr:hypothetical protein IMSHALPRED_008388 [Imshaugia aleurites]
MSATTTTVPSTLRLQYLRDWLAAEKRWHEKHPTSPPLTNPIHDWSDGTCAMMLPTYIDEWMDRFPPTGSNIAPTKTSKRKAIARRLRALCRKFSCM